MSDFFYWLCVITFIALSLFGLLQGAWWLFEQLIKRIILSEQEEIMYLERVERNNGIQIERRADWPTGGGR
jgi:hypothetical protein